MNEHEEIPPRIVGRGHPVEVVNNQLLLSTFLGGDFCNWLEQEVPLLPKLGPDELNQVQKALEGTSDPKRRKPVFFTGTEGEVMAAAFLRVILPQTLDDYFF